MSGGGADRTEYGESSEQLDGLLHGQFSLAGYDGHRRPTLICRGGVRTFRNIRAAPIR
jgi:hypothetical protein